MIANGDTTQERGNRLIEPGGADSIALVGPTSPIPTCRSVSWLALLSVKPTGQRSMRPGRMGTPTTPRTSALTSSAVQQECHQNVPRRTLAVASAQNAAAEDLFIKTSRSVDVGDGDESV